MTENTYLLEVADLSVSYNSKDSHIRAVNDLSFALREGEFLGLIGESGCGKTTVAKSVARLLPPNAEVTSGEIYYRGLEILALEADQMRKLRWKEISFVPQNAMNSLDPVYTVGTQMVEAFQTHHRVKKEAALSRAAELFSMVGIGPERLNDYPHQFSGGMKQRAIIAMSLILDPGLVIADEPTTGLDVIVQDQIMLQLANLLKQLGKSMLLITHDVSIVAENCDKVLVMYGGRLAEYGSVRDVYKRPFHPYTLGLQNSFPRINEPEMVMISIPGHPPSLGSPLAGCPFVERCPFSAELCVEELPPLLEVEAGHWSLCHFPDKVEEFRLLARDQTTWDRPETLNWQR